MSEVVRALPNIALQRVRLLPSDLLVWTGADGEDRTVTVPFIERIEARHPWPRFAIQVRKLLGHEWVVFDPLDDAKSEADLMHWDAVVTSLLKRTRPLDIPIGQGWTGLARITLEPTKAPQDRGQGGAYRGGGERVRSEDRSTLLDRAREWLRSGAEQSWVKGLENPRWTFATEASLTGRHLYLRAGDDWSRVELTQFRGVAHYDDDIELFAFGRDCLVRFANRDGEVARWLREREGV